MTSIIKKLNANLPWLVRYPFERTKAVLSRNVFEKKHLIFTIANHFEPSWKVGGHHDIETQLRRLDVWHKLAETAGENVKDSDGTKFRHTNFFPIEQYEKRLVEKLANLQKDGLGEVEIHLHHGIDAPDTSESLRNTLIKYRDILAENHKCLSRSEHSETPMYAFVHGNLALGNSWDGKYCGVDNELKILQETGCYADLTLPAAPEVTQVSIINQIYECALPLDEKIPHRKGNRLEFGGKKPQLPIIYQGPLILNWTRKLDNFPLPIPRIDDGALTGNQPLDLARLNRWISANVTIAGKSDWVFIKLYCHGFFDYDQSACIGEDAQRFFNEIIENGEKTGDYKVHFASARESFNMISAAIDGKKGTPNDFRDYKLKSIMSENAGKVSNSVASFVTALQSFAFAYLAL